MDKDEGRDVPPLSIRDLAATATPAQFLQEDVFGRMRVEAAPVSEIDSQAAGELAGIQGRAARHEQVDLQLRGLVDQIGVGSIGVVTG